jgi:hypothetical protein
MSPMAAYEVAELGTSPLSQDHPQARDGQRSLPRLRGALAVPAAVYGRAALPGAHQRRLSVPASADWQSAQPRCSYVKRSSEIARKCPSRRWWCCVSSGAA